MINPIQITLNHLEAAKEHIVKNDMLCGSPTFIQAARITLFDMVFNKTVYNEKYKAHLVYEVQKIPTLGIRLANVIRVYVPKEHRGKGVATLMYDEIKEKIVIGGANDSGKYESVGSIYIIRTSI